MSLNRGFQTFITALFFAVFICYVNPVFAYNPEAVQAYNEAVDMSKNGNLQESIDLFKKAIVIDPAFTDAYYNLAAIYEYQGNEAQALANFEVILKKNPNDADVAYKVASIYFKKKEYNKSLNTLNLIFSENSKYVEAQALSKRIRQEIARVSQQQKLAQQSANKPVASKPATVSTAVNKPAAKPAEIKTVSPAVTANVEASKITFKDFQGPTGIAKDSNGNLYIANYTGNNILQITPAGARNIFAASPSINGPIGIAIDPSNNLYVANYASNEVIKITPLRKTSVILRGVNKPYYLYLDKAGMLYVSEQGSNTVIRVKVI